MPTLLKAVADPQVDLVALEREKISGAVRTDFILSAEIVVITLGTVADASFGTRLAVLSGIAALMTVGVYGLVAGIVKLDDAGLYLARSAGGGAARLKRALGRGMLVAAPWLMKGLSIAGTAAMFLVGGGILTHGIPALHHWVEATAAAASLVEGVGPMLSALAPLLLDALTGIAAGGLIVAAVSGVRRLIPRIRPSR